MKPQDIVFLIVLIILLFFRKNNYLVVVGLVCLVTAIPLFAKHIFFTAEHLTYYATGFFLIAIMWKVYENRN